MWFSNFDNFFSFSRNYVLSADDTIYYTFNFYTTNALPATAIIDITFSITPLSNCYVYIGLEDISSSKIRYFIWFLKEK